MNNRTLNSTKHQGSFLLQLKNIAKQIRTTLSYLLLPKSYSQLGEDLIIINHLYWLGKNPQKRGFYIDIGAYHPLDGSNTYRLYRQGSSGIVVDIGTQKKNLFSLLRSRDIFIDAAVVPDDFQETTVLFKKTDGYGEKTDSLVDYGMLKSALENQSPNVQEVATIRISDLLRQGFSSISKDPEWLVLNIDIEGLDADVVRSIDFDEYPFDLICLEMYPSDKWNKISNYLESSINLYLESVDYSLQSICGPSLIYVRKSSLMSS